MAERFVLSDPLNAIYFGAARWRLETRDEDKKTRGFSLENAGSDTGIHCTVLITPRLSVKTPLTPAPNEARKKVGTQSFWFLFPTHPPCIELLILPGGEGSEGGGGLLAGRGGSGTASPLIPASRGEEREVISVPLGGSCMALVL